MNTCDACRFWKPERVRIVTKGECRAVSNTTEQPDEFSIESEPYEGGKFITGPKFGCIHWEAK